MNDAEQIVLLRQQIPRWVSASVMQMLKTKIERFNTGKITYGFESDITDDIKRANPELITIIFDGPDRQQRAKNQIRFLFTYTLIVTTHNMKNDMYAHSRTLGVALECFPPCIPVYRYGDGSLDSGNELGTLTQVTDPNTFGHGSPGADIPVYQSSVSAQYRMDYSED